MRYRILGDVEVCGPAGWRGVGAAKWRTLLAVLLLAAGRPVAPEALVDELWAGSPPMSARKLVQVYVHRVRRLIDDPAGLVLRTGTTGYLLAVAADEVDAGRFEALAAAGRERLGADPAAAADVLAEAIGLWRGPALAGVPRTQRVRLAVDRLERARLEAVECWADAQFALDRPDLVPPRVRELAASHPVREELHVRLIRGLLASGHRSEAAQAYRRLGRALAAELGIGPGDAARALGRELGSDAPRGHRRTPRGPGMRAAPTRRNPSRATVSPVPAQLPPAAVPFVGRRREITAVRRALREARRAHRVGVCLLTGMGGCGKSALAVRVGHALRARYPDGTLYADLRGSGADPVSPAEVLAALLRAVGVARPPASVAEASAAYRSVLANRRILVVLDDAGSAAQVRPLLPAGPGCAAVVTSRRTLPTLDAAATCEVGPLAAGDAVGLLAALTGGVPRGTLATLAGLCDGVPLALRIVAARLRTADPAALVARLSNERRRLDELQIDDLAVRTAFEAGYRMLADSADPADRAAARVWRLLADTGLREHSPTTFGVLLGVAPGDRAGDGAADPLAERLLAAHLVEARGPGRYRMHDLAALYAAERAAADETPADRSAALRRLVAWYADAADRAARLVGTVTDGRAYAGPEFGGPDAARRWLDAERGNARELTRRAAAVPSLRRDATRLGSTLASYLTVWGYDGEAEAVGHLVLDAARRTGDRGAEATALSRLGAAYLRQGDDASAVDCLRRSLDLYRTLDDEGGAAGAWNNLGLAHRRTGRPTAALTCLRTSLAIRRRLGDEVKASSTLDNIGLVYLDLGDTKRAVRCHEEALDLARRLDRHHLAGLVMINLGWARYRAGDTGPAVGWLRRAVVTCRDVGHRLGEAEALRRLADILDAAGHPAAAARRRERATALADG